MRDYIERIVRDHQVAHDQRHLADQEAIRQQRDNLQQQRMEDRDALRLAREGFSGQLEATKDELSKRLDVINGYRSEMIQDRARYLPRETFDTATGAIMDRVSHLEAFQNRADGKYLSQDSFQEKLDEWSEWRTTVNNDLSRTIDRKTFDEYKESQAGQRRTLLYFLATLGAGVLINLLLNFAQNAP
jgi:hypothetical protein